MPSEWYEYECGTCGKQFPSGWQARDQHCEAIGHNPPDHECDCCERNFTTYDKLFRHMQRKNHFQYECRQCYETWPDEEQRQEHEANDHYLCADCGRSFNSRQDVWQHLRSRIHIGSNVACPFCNKAYTTAAGVTHHVERGSCPKATNMKRDTLYAFVRAHDPKGAISKKLIGWHGDKKYEATEWAWNGSGYECVYFCHKAFSTLQALNQHLASPIHQQALYHCPNTKCAKEFKILGGLVSHLESEMCGTMRFNQVQAGVKSLIRGGRLLM